jgi:hypothetical protein
MDKYSVFQDKYFSIGEKLLFWFLGLAFEGGKTKCAICGLGFQLAENVPCMVS